MLVLTETTDNLQAVLGSAVTTNQLTCVSSWRDVTTTTYVPGRTVTVTNSTSDVNIVPSPASSTQRVVDFVSIYNKDTANADVTIKFDANGTEYIIFKATLVTGGRLEYTSENGWQVYNDTTITTLNDYHSGYSDYAAISNPSAPSAGVLRLFARTVSGRTVPKWVEPSGVDTPFQAALWGNNIVMYMPNTGTTAGVNLGTPWAVGTTVAHPAPTAGIYTQMKRTTSTNVVTTQNQALGVSSIVSTAAQFWRGNSAGLGGFFFFARFGIETLTAASPNATRMFVGLQSGTTNILVSDTVPAISCVGLWHDTTDGANVINLLTKNGTTATKNTLDGSPTTPYQTGQAYDFYLFAKPNDSVIYYRLDNLNTGAVLVDSSVSTTLPANTTFMGPVVGMSNGTANTTASTVGIGVNRIYIESDK
jgi:hypothetical protein